MTDLDRSHVTAQGVTYLERAPLSSLAGLLAGDRVLARLLSDADARVAVSENARAFVCSAVADLGAAPVLLLATATTAEAERLVHELRAFLGRSRVLFLPAWETLPFERVSPSIETMGERQETIARVQA